MGWRVGGGAVIVLSRAQGRAPFGAAE